MRNLFQKSLFKMMLLTLIITMSGVLPQNASFAATQSQELVEVTKVCDILVQLTYDNEKPKSIVFVSPSGTRYQEGVSPESQLKYFQGDKWINYKIFNAEAGTWYIEYDKGKSKNAEFTVALSAQNLWIQSFAVNRIDGTNAEVTFETTYDGSGSSYNYEIYAVANSGEGEGAKLLETGNAQSDSVVTKNVDLSELSSYGAYKLRLEVYTDTGSFEVFDSADTAQFEYTNPRAVSSIENIDVSVDTKSMLVTLNWSEYTYRRDFFVSVFADKEAEPIFYQELTDWESDEIYFDYLEYHSKLTVYVYTRDNGVLSEPLIKEVNVKDLAVTIDSSDITNQSQAKISYNMQESTEATLILNDASQLVRLDGKDSFAVTLVDGDNTLSVKYMDNGIEYIVSKDIYLDRMPPELELYEDLDKKNVKSAELIIVGKTESAAAVEINGQKVTVNPTGEFSHTVKLQGGENSLEIKAIDTAGNASSQTISVSYGLSDGSVAGSNEEVSYLPLLITLGISLVIILLALLFMKKRKNEKTHKKNVAFKFIMLNISSYLTVILAAVAVIMFVINIIEFVRISQVVSDTSFLNIAETSVDTAYDYLVRKEKYFWTMIVTGILAVVFAVGSIILKSVYKKKTKN